MLILIPENDRYRRKTSMYMYIVHTGLTITSDLLARFLRQWSSSDGQCPLCPLKQQPQLKNHNAKWPNKHPRTRDEWHPVYFPRDNRETGWESAIVRQQMKMCECTVNVLLRAISGVALQVLRLTLILCWLENVLSPFVFLRMVTGTSTTLNQRHNN